MFLYFPFDHLFPPLPIMPFNNLLEVECWFSFSTRGWWENLPNRMSMLQLSVTDESEFLKKLEENHHTSYKSRRYGSNRYAGSPGRPKRGSRTRWTTGHFLPALADGSRTTLKYALTDGVQLSSVTQSMERLISVNTAAKVWHFIYF